MLDVKKLLTKILSKLYVSGTTTAGSITWNYRKYADGILEMWGQATTTLAIATYAGTSGTTGGLYTTASTYDIAMPSFVRSVRFITAELSGGGWADITAFTNPPQLRLYAPTSYGSAS